MDSNGIFHVCKTVLFTICKSLPYEVFGFIFDEVIQRPLTRPAFSGTGAEPFQGPADGFRNPAETLR